ncbi:RDD family protein [Aeromicrobium sp. Sec7.5]|uniref:RDD family protein n=1 Tax=Aeromicrobium sp. Sec7.5 TaxID=3121276 RepID=UPI002FE477EC
MTESSSPASRVGTVTGPFASLGARFGAFVIDRMLLLAFVAPAAALYVVAFEDGSPGGRQLFFAGIPTLLTLVLLIVQWVNLARRGRTIGGFALGVSVVRGEGGTPLGFGKALLRTIVLQLIASVPLLVLVAMFLSTKHPRRQARHDSAVGAVVVKATPESLVEDADRRAREAPIPISGPPVMLDSSAPPVGLGTGPAPAAPSLPAPSFPAPSTPAAPAAPGLPGPPTTAPAAPAPRSPEPAASLPPLPLPPPPVAPDADTRDLVEPAAAPAPEPEPTPEPVAPPAPPAAAPAGPAADERTPPPIGPAAPATPPPSGSGGRLITSVPGFGPAGDASPTEESRSAPEPQPEPTPEPQPQPQPAPAPVEGRRRATPAVEEEPPEVRPEPDAVDGATRVGQRRGARPTWVLVGEDGRRIAVRSTVVVGRDPETGEHTGALPAAIPDPERSVSKTHAVLTVAAGALRVDDLHSTNGTHVLSHGVESAVQPGQPLEIQPGDTVWFGDRAFVAEHGG